MNANNAENQAKSTSSEDSQNVSLSLKQVMIVQLVE